MRMSLLYKQSKLENDNSQINQVLESISTITNTTLNLNEIYNISKHMLVNQLEHSKSVETVKSQWLKNKNKMLIDCKKVNSSYEKLKYKSIKQRQMLINHEKERIYSIEKSRNEAIERILSIISNEGIEESRVKENKEINSIYDEFYKANHVEIGELKVRSDEEIQNVIKEKTDQIKRVTVENNYLIKRNRRLSMNMSQSLNSE
jgi:hypothetical protein